ncbi:MAG: YigZ family protein [Bacteroidetes bacterium GWF2_38_335]|nr:MAG: YigZ family protein [Bacteroidetes bacterium GWF2_38_335]OFY77560.1 MAG: YigZ family protein [Bacteroidetes bacterium RIFOXYA12_FULL_38_20]HBS87142.1 YigZ family protein [Bacteroidales bacterium]
MTDLYKTVEKKSEGIFRDRGSKFIALAFPVNSEDEIKTIQKQLRSEYYDARHHCFAWRLGAEKTHYRVNDDGEPSGSSGLPIYGQIQSFDLTNILVVVIRYFGGTKLGIPGLINAYRTATAEAFKAAKIIEKTVNDIFELDFEYESMNDVMKIIKDEGVEQFDQVFEMRCSLKITIRKSETERITERFKKIDKLQCKYLHTE